MLRKKKDNSDYEIDRELTGKFAIEKNAEYQEKIEQLEEENKKLNIKVASLEGEIKGLNYTIDKLKEENQTLELWLDNKEKLNEEYRKQIDLLKCQSLGPNELADSLYDADKTIERLNGRIANLKEEVEDRGKIINKLREELSAYDREYYDEDKKAKNIFMEEDTLQELRDIGEIE